MWRLLLRIFLFSIGSVCYALLGILSQLSKSPDGSYAYSMPSVVLMAEAVKLCLSVAFLWNESDSPKRFYHELRSGSFFDWLRSSVPALLYAINNILDMKNNQHMDPATEQVLVQLKILTTGIAWWIVFRAPLGTRKWLSLMLLFLGAACAAWPSASDDKANSLHIDSIGFLCVTIYVWISAIAGVYNEWLYKRVGGSGKVDNFHVSNIRLYIMGCCCHLFFHVRNKPGHPIFGLLDGYNIYTWGLVATYAMMGLLLAQVMKYFDSIVKLFISGSSMYVTSVLSWLIFSIEPTMTFIVGLVVVSAALIMYNAERIFSQTQERTKEA